MQKKQLTSKQKQEMKSILTDAISECMENEKFECLDMWFGERIYEYMADAALSVLFGQRDVQIFLVNEGMLEE